MLEEWTRTIRTLLAALLMIMVTLPMAARKANYFILRDIPQGKYSPKYMLDMETAAESKDVTARVN